MSAFEDAASTYEAFGNDEPFYAVLSYGQYRAARLDKDAFYETGRDQIGRVIEAIEAKRLNLPRRRALDFGCGVGRLTNALAEHFDEVVGVDVSQSMVDAATANRRRDNCQFVVNKQPDLSRFDDATFDFIYSDITIQHIPSPASENYICDFVRLLSPGGLAVFLVPDGPDFQPGSLAAKANRFYRESFRPWYKRIRGKHPVQIHTIARRRVETLVADGAGELLSVERPEGFVNSKRRRTPLFYWVQKPVNPATRHSKAG